MAERHWVDIIWFSRHNGLKFKLYFSGQHAVALWMFIKMNQTLQNLFSLTVSAFFALCASSSAIRITCIYSLKPWVLAREVFEYAFCFTAQFTIGHHKTLTTEAKLYTKIIILYVCKMQYYTTLVISNVYSWKRYPSLQPGVHPHPVCHPVCNVLSESGFCNLDAYWSTERCHWSCYLVDQKSVSAFIAWQSSLPSIVHWWYKMIWW